MSLDPSYWGKDLWKSLYCIALTYPRKYPPKEHQQAAIHFFNSLSFLLPCFDCREEYTEQLQKHSVQKAVKDRETLSKWLNLIHNNVNRKLGKKPVDLDLIKKNVEERRFKNKDDDDIYVVKKVQTSLGPKTYLTKITKDGYLVIPRAESKTYTKADGFVLHYSDSKNTKEKGCGCGKKN